MSSINAAVKSVFVAGSVGRFVTVVTAMGCRLLTGTYFVSAYAGERGCKGNTVLSFRALSGEVIAMGWREACDDVGKGANAVILSASIVSDLSQIEKFFTRKLLLTSVEIGSELPLPALNYNAEITIEDILGTSTN